MNKLKLLSFILLIEIFTSLLLEKNFGSTKDDFDKCRSENDTTKCASVQFETKNFQCCKFKFKPDTTGDEMCNVMVKPLRPAQEELNTINGEIMTKEIGGYELFSNSSMLMTNYYDFTCQDGNLNYVYEPDNYTVEEKEIFKSSNHCLYYKGIEYSQENITQHICYNADLAISKDSRVSCGYYEFKLNFQDASTDNYKACFLFNEDILTTKNLGFWTKVNVEEIVANAESKKGKYYTSYQFKATDSKGQYFIYYSINDSVITSTDSNSNTSGFLYSRNILLLILFYILSY